MLRYRLLLCLPFFAIAVVPGSLQAQTGQQEDAFEFVINPVVPQRADPWVFKHTDGFYYFTGSVPAYDRIELRRAQTLKDLAPAEPVTVWRKYDSGPMSYHIWAPELHFIDGKWYVYFAAGRAEEVFDIRMYVLENAAANPLEGEWVEKGQLKTNWESFSLDATSFEHRGQRYLVWAQNDPDIRGNTNLYIAEMENPWTIRGEQVMLTKPEFDWEIQGYLVNEGAAVLKRNGRIFISYSGSATDARYAMGLLTADEDANLLDAASWKKSPTPVFVSNPENGVYGPGHNSFTTSKDGTTDVLVYHGRSYRDIMGNSLYDPNRQARMQALKWNADGTPDFGVPVPDGPHVITGTPPERPNRRGSGAATTEGPEMITLWPDGPPDSNGLTGPEAVDRCVGNITEPTLTIYRPDAGVVADGAVLVLPGGGYSVVCNGHEGEEVAKWLNGLGYTAGVLKYRMPNGHDVVPIQDAQQALRLMRSRADEFGVSPNKVGILGFSAGGHLASTVGTHFDEDFSGGKGDRLNISNRPDFMVLVYPVVTMMNDYTHKGSQRGLLGDNPADSQLRRFSNQLQVTEQTPPTFLVHSSDDQAVPSFNSISLYTALKANGVTTEMHVFERGGHGYGLSIGSQEHDWTPLAEIWLKHTLGGEN